MSAITTHVLDTSLGRPAAGVPVVLERLAGDAWVRLAQAHTDGDGRVRDLGPDQLAEGLYRLDFDTATYFAARGARAFYPRITVTFHVADGSEHYHVPLLLSPFAYSTYRGS